MQTFTVKVKDAKDISTAHLPATFEWTDEFYYVDHMPAGLHVLLAGDLTTLDDPGKDKYPGKNVRRRVPAGLAPRVRGRPRVVHRPRP